MCDGIDQLEIGIACLVETNTHGKHPCGEASLKETTKRHWQHSRIATSETE